MTQATSFSRRCKRFFKHVTTTSAAGRRAFPEATLKAIEDAIWQGEQIHGAEVRLIIEPALSMESLCKNVSNRQRALALFAEYGIWDTEENCGVLIYVNLAERHVDIVADRNAGRKIEPGQWQAICTTMTQGFASSNYHDSTLAAIETLNELLRKHFRPTNGRPNQLPDAPIIL